MKRRAFLAVSGGIVVSAAGCLGSSGPGGASGDGDPDDGYPPQFADTPDERSVDTDSYDVTVVDGNAVPLAPIEDVYYWYKRREARMVDARGETQYDRSHIYGSVLSPAPSGRDGDPVSSWPKSDRIVCYCGCPHHLSSVRASNLVDSGFERVYVIDEGFWEWHGRDYPMAGSEVDSQPALYTIRGRTSPSFSGETAWAWHEPSGQREAAPISEGGSYTLELRFEGLDPDSPISVETPEYRVEGSLGELTADVVTG